MTIKITFATIEERDAFLTEHFPDRKCGDAPGSYDTKKAELGVLCETVWVTPKEFEFVPQPYLGVGPRYNVRKEREQ